MAKVYGYENYSYSVEKQSGLFQRIKFLDILNEEGVLPGEVLRLLMKGPSIKGLNTDNVYLVERTGSDSYSIRIVA